MRRQSRNDDGSRKVELDVKDEECEERDDGQEGGDCSKEEYESSKGDEGRENLGHDDDKENYSEEGDDDKHDDGREGDECGDGREGDKGNKEEYESSKNR